MANASLKRLVRAAGNMGKSAHPLIRLIRAKFEHACMVSDRVQNVGVFVEKYLHEYRVAGSGFTPGDAWRRRACGCAFCLDWPARVPGTRPGMADQVIQYGAAGAGRAILLLLFHAHKR